MKKLTKLSALAIAAGVNRRLEHYGPDAERSAESAAAHRPDRTRKSLPAVIGSSPTIHRARRWSSTNPWWQTARSRCRKKRRSIPITTTSSARTGLDRKT